MADVGMQGCTLDITTLFAFDTSGLMVNEICPTIIFVFFFLRDRLRFPFCLNKNRFGFDLCETHIEYPLD